MTLSEDTRSQHNSQNIDARKARYRTWAGKRNIYERVLRDYYEYLRTSPSSTKEYIAQSLFTLQEALNQPELEQNVLTDYLSEIIRFVENVGLGLEFSKNFMDDAIDVYRRVGYSPVDLYLAKTKLLRLDSLESPERETAFLEARKDAEGSENKEDLVRVLLEFAAYYTEVSKYEESLNLCREAEELIQNQSELQKYAPKVLLYFGMNYTPLFNYKLAKYYLLQAKKLLEQHPMPQSGQLKGGAREVNSAFSLAYLGLTPESERNYVLGGILNYLGRIAQAEGNGQGAMDYYVQELINRQTYLPEDLSGLAFCHLRLGELLLSCSRSFLDQAGDHLRMSRDIFDQIQYSSAGRVQVSLDWAIIRSRNHDYRGARDAILAVREETRKMRFSRGELLCSVELFWLDIRHLYVHRAAYTLFQVMRGWSRNELSRNRGLGLIVTYILQMISNLLKRLAQSLQEVMSGGNLEAPLTSCRCPLHQSAKADMPLSH